MHAATIRNNASALDVSLDVVDRLLHRGDLLGLFVRDLALELFFQRHHQLDGVQRVGTQIIDERCAGGDFLFLDAELFDDDFLDAFFDGAHWGYRSSWSSGGSSFRIPAHGCAVLL
ncbi:hypothetical protein XFF6166_180015 [Xanthomonas citri pv. fuscans]|nr:hypothetical protein XFF6166_180015 [Xanthomonas citri pv. fuscans]